MYYAYVCIVQEFCAILSFFVRFYTVFLHSNILEMSLFLKYLSLSIILMFSQLNSWLILLCVLLWLLAYRWFYLCLSGVQRFVFLIAYRLNYVWRVAIFVYTGYFIYHILFRINWNNIFLCFYNSIKLLMLKYDNFTFKSFMIFFILF